MVKEKIKTNGNYYRLTNPEKRIWYNEKIYQEPAIHNIGGYVKLKGTIELDIMEKAINKVIKEHDAFRIGFFEDNGEPYQYVKSFTYQSLQVKDFSVEGNPEEAFEKWQKDWMPISFDIYEDSLYQFVLCKMGANSYRIMLKIHHIIADGWSIQLIAELITKEYYYIQDGILEEESIESYINYLAVEEKYLQSEQFKKNEKFWMEQFKDIKKIKFLQSSKGLRGKRKSFVLNGEETRILKQFAQEKKVFLQTVVMAAYYLYRSTCIKEKDITIGVPVFNRYGKKEKNTVGMFTSTMVYRFCIDENVKVAEYVKQMNRRLKDGLRNQRYPYNKLIEELKKEHGSLENMYDVSINYYNTDFNESFQEWDASFEECYSGYQFFDLQIVIKEWKNSGEISFCYDYKTDVYNEFQIGELHLHLKRIIKYMEENSEQLVSTVPVFQEEDSERFLRNYNDTNSPYPKDKTILQLFEDCAKHHPEKVAIEYNAKKLTYRELDEQANQIADFLYNKLHKRNEIIGIQTSHSIESIVVILGVLKAGCTYLPIEPSIPAERLEYIITNSGLTTIFTNFISSYEQKVEAININNLNLESYSREKIDVGDYAELVYIIYTSGTTGKPKGVMITQQGLVNYIYWAKKVYGVTEEDSFALYSSLAFDLTVTSIFTPLISGARILVYCDDQEKYVLYRIIEENRTTILKVTPAHLKLILDMDVSKSLITRFIVGGEDLKYKLADQIYQQFNKKIHIFNEYGPTETVVGCMIYEYDETKCYGKSVPIGIPSDNVQIYLLDQDLHPVLPGEEGEMYIAGVGVAKGYLNNAELTKERFIYNPFSKNKKFMYKTGDIARFVDTAVMEYVCRVDNQIKVNGYRIELGEIEECIKKLDGIEEAVVDYRKLPNGNKVLCAFYLGKEKLERKMIREHIKKYLPDYMVPVYYTQVDEFKLTVNGKLDRCNLPELDMENQDYMENLDEIKAEALSDVVKKILNINEVSMSDNFYSIGGDSIKAIQMTSRLSEMGYKVKVKDVLSSVCLGEIVQFMEGAEEELYEIENCTDSIKNLPIYQWFLDMKLENPDYYVQSIRICIDKRITSFMLTKAFQSIIKTHDALRLNYSQEKGFYYQEKYLEQNFEVKCIDGEKCNIEEEISVVKQNINCTSELPFKALFIERNKQDSNLLVLIAHHIVVDGVSWRIIVDDLHTILNQLMENKEIKLVKEFTTINQWYEAIKKYQDVAMQQINYWKKQIKPYSMSKKWNMQFESCDLIQDNISLTIKLSDEVTNVLFDKIAKEQKFHISEVMLTALIKTFMEKYKENEIVLLLESHGRESNIGNCDLSRTVAWFTAMYPVRFSFKDTSDCLLMMDEVKTSLKRVPDSGIGYGILKYMSRVLKDEEKYIRFNYLGSVGNELTNEWIKKIEPDFKQNSDGINKNTCLMDINCIYVEEQFLVDFTCNKNFLKEDDLDELAVHFESNLSKLVYEYSHDETERVFVSEFTAVSLNQDDFEDLFE